jgi:glycosyltransferase involved in cell wall biosynthesis
MSRHTKILPQRCGLAIAPCIVRGLLQIFCVKISVIIPAFNEERLLGETLRSVKAAMNAFARRNWEMELIVCDNNSTDRTAEIAREAGATVVFEPINQIARARNSGAAAATGDWLVFVDADSHPSAELFDDVAEQIVSGKCLAGGTTVKLEGHHPKASLVTQLWNSTSRVMRWLAGSFIFCEAKTFKKIGGFSNELFASEEIELSQRLKAVAKTERKQIVILHRHPMTTSARKIHLYTVREHVWFLTKLVFSGGKVLNSREACHTWYDGRR